MNELFPQASPELVRQTTQKAKEHVKQINTAMLKDTPFMCVYDEIEAEDGRVKLDVVLRSNPRRTVAYILPNRQNKFHLYLLKPGNPEQFISVGLFDNLRALKTKLLAYFQRIRQARARQMQTRRTQARQPQRANTTTSSPSVTPRVSVTPRRTLSAPEIARRKAKLIAALKRMLPIRSYSFKIDSNNRLTIIFKKSGVSHGLGTISVQNYLRGNGSLGQVKLTVSRMIKETLKKQRRKWRDFFRAQIRGVKFKMGRINLRTSAISSDLIMSYRNKRVDVSINPAGRATFRIHKVSNTGRDRYVINTIWRKSCSYANRREVLVRIKKYFGIGVRNTA